MAYPWIFLVADDHGRFEYDPRGIWSKCFSAREDVSIEDVALWLAEYEREELLFRYHIDGDLAYWYKFKGRKPSERRPSEYPDPAQFKRRGKGATRGRKGGDEGATEGRNDRDKTSPELELIGTRAERSGSELAPAVADAPIALVPSKPWTAEAIDDHRELLGVPVAGKILAALKPLVDEYQWAVVRPVWRRWLQTPDAKFGAIKFAEIFLALKTPPARASPGKPSIGDEAMRIAQEAIAEHEARRG